MTKQEMIKRAVTTGVAFMVIQAVLAALWRRVIMAGVYESDRNFYDITEPTVGVVVMGLIFYFLSGTFMGMLYGHKADGGSGTRFTAVMGVLYWLVHDFSYPGRHELQDVWLYLLLEAILVAAIFVPFRLVLKRIFGD